MEILQKGTVSAEFRANRPKHCGSCVFPQNFHTRKLGEIKVFTQCMEKIPVKSKTCCQQNSHSRLKLRASVSWTYVFNLNNLFKSYLLTYSLEVFCEKAPWRYSLTYFRTLIGKNMWWTNFLSKAEGLDIIFNNSINVEKVLLIVSLKRKVKKFYRANDL